MLRSFSFKNENTFKTEQTYADGYMFKNDAYKYGKRSVYSNNRTKNKITQKHSG